MTIIVVLFRFNVGLHLTLSMANLYSKILDLAKVYQWQREFLTLALNFSTHIVESYFFDLSWWNISAKWQVCFCNSLMIKNTSFCYSACDFVRHSACDFTCDSICNSVCNYFCDSAYNHAAILAKTLSSRNNLHCQHEMQIML